MNTVEVQIRRRSGIVTYTAAPTPTPGLYVAATGSEFSIVHARSGLIIGVYENSEAALSAAVDLGDVHDWTLPAESIKAMTREHHMSILAICVRWGAHMGAPPETLDDLADS